ncbi:MAG: hypothetical protein IKR59_05630 [Lachnospiraceae bacterium]|nr:hypothetical protein [Lachnospiraceae bacterium]
MKHILSAILAVLVLLLSACSMHSTPEVVTLKEPAATTPETTTTAPESTTVPSETPESPESTPEPETIPDSPPAPETTTTVPETTTAPEPITLPSGTTAPHETTTAPTTTAAPLPDYSTMRYPYLYINTELTDANQNGRIDFTVTYLDTNGLTIKQASESNWAQGLAYYGASYSIWDSPYGYCAHVKGAQAANEAGYIFNEDEIAAIAARYGISTDGIPYNDLQQ